MQTFLPYPNFTDSLACLDYRRLGKQRIETKQLLYACFNDNGWANHPAAKMWKGSEIALALYGKTSCDVWRSRGYQDNTGIFFEEYLHTNANCPIIYPSWFGDPKFHRSHQSNLLRKMPEYYSQFDWDVSPHLPYVWPRNELKTAA